MLSWSSRNTHCNHKKLKLFVRINDDKIIHDVFGISNKRHKHNEGEKFHVNILWVMLKSLRANATVLHEAMRL